MGRNPSSRSDRHLSGLAGPSFPPGNAPVAATRQPALSPTFRLSIPFYAIVPKQLERECYAPKLGRTGARCQPNDHRAAALQAMRCDDAPCLGRTFEHWASAVHVRVPLRPSGCHSRDAGSSRDGAGARRHRGAEAISYPPAHRPQSPP
jgi:hypothetical protein